MMFKKDFFSLFEAYLSSFSHVIFVSIFLLPFFSSRDNEVSLLLDDVFLNANLPVTNVAHFLSLFKKGKELENRCDTRICIEDVN